MKFNVNSPILFVMVGILILVVLAQSVFFLVRALRRAKEIGMEKTVIKSSRYCNSRRRHYLVKEPWCGPSLAAPFDHRLAHL